MLRTHWSEPIHARVVPAALPGFVSMCRRLESHLLTIAFAGMRRGRGAYARRQDQVVWPLTRAQMMTMTDVGDRLGVTGVQTRAFRFDGWLSNATKTDDRRDDRHRDSRRDRDRGEWAAVHWRVLS